MMFWICERDVPWVFLFEQVEAVRVCLFNMSTLFSLSFLFGNLV